MEKNKEEKSVMDVHKLYDALAKILSKREGVEITFKLERRK
jgi:hypothetical protein